MNPGRELDALVAAKVMRCTVLERKMPKRPSLITEFRENNGPVVVDAQETYSLFSCQCSPVHVHNDEWGQIPDYSTDIAAAWGLLEASKVMHYRRIELSYDGQWMFVNEDDSGRSNGAFVKAPTMPHAICLAALKAVGAL